MGCHRGAKKISMIGRCCSAALLILGASSLFNPILAADISGIWSSDASKCDKIFKKTGSQVSFVDKTGIHGTGFIIEGNKMRGATSKCTIKNKNEKGGVINIVASCANDVMFSDVQFSAKLADNDTLVRLFPGMPELQMAYSKCHL